MPYLRLALALSAALFAVSALCYSALTAGSAKARTSLTPMADGDIDPTFGMGGKVVPGQFSGFDSIYDTVIQPDGKIVVAGESDFSFVLGRYTSNGQLDATFGTSGVVRVSTPVWAGGFRKGDRIALALQTDGKIVLGGTVIGSAGAGSDFGLMRFTSNGASDTSFGTNGLVTTDIDNGDTNVGSQSTRRQNYLRDIALQPDGKILGVGGLLIGSEVFFESGSPATVRYNVDGSLDASFGSGGVVKLGGDALAIQPDGKIIIAGGPAYQFVTTNFHGDQHPMTVRRLNSNGTIDTSFNRAPTVGNTTFAPGMVGQAFNFDGSGDAVSIGNPPALHYTITFSIEAWVKRGSTVATSSSGNGVIFGWGPDGYVFGIKPDGHLFLSKDAKDNNIEDDTETVSNTVVVSDTNFHHIAVTSTSGNTGVNFYVDGVADTPRRYQPVYRFDNNSNAAIGAEGGAFGGSFLGLVDELNIYSTVLTQAQIQSIFSAGSAGKCKPGAPAPGCVAVPIGLNAWYPGDGDTSEIGGGVGSLAFANFFNKLEATARDVLIQPDGRIVAAGYTFSNTTGNPKVCALARFNDDGTPDTSFDGDGKLTTNAGGYSEINRIALQPDGSIVAAGVKNLYTGTDDFLVMRYQSFGALDPNFGTGGMVSTDFGAGRRDWANALALQADGRIIAAGVTTSPGTGRDFAIARYNLNGSLDDGATNDATPGDSFGVGGRIVTALTSSLSAKSVWDVAVQPDGKVLAGTAYGSGFLLMRFNPDGSLDPSFGVGGAATASFDNFLGPRNNSSTNLLDYGVQLRAIELLPNGKIVAAGGQYAQSIGSDTYGMIARFNADGSPDNSFSGDGLVEFLIGVDDAFGNSSDGLHAMTSLPNGSIVVGVALPMPIGCWRWCGRCG